MKDRYKYKRNIFFITPLLVLLSFIMYFFFSTFFINLAWHGSKIKENIFAKDRKSLQEENNLLKVKMDFFKNSEKVISILESENIKLKEELGYQLENQKKREVFNIVFNNNPNIYSSVLVLDPEEKTDTGDLVFSYKNFIIGEVYDRVSNLSKIKLFSSFGNKNTFYIKDEGEIKLKVEAEGDGSGVIKVLAPRDFRFENKDKVFLVYENNTDYIIAYLVDTEFKTQDTNKVLYFKTFTNTSLLNQVSIQKKIEHKPETVFLETQ